MKHLEKAAQQVLEGSIHKSPIHPNSYNTTYDTHIGFLSSGFLNGIFNTTSRYPLNTFPEIKK